MRPVRQFVQIEVTYAVYTTRELFHADNPLLEQVLTVGNGGLPQRILVVIDKPVAGSRVGLLDDVTRSLRSQPGCELVAPPLLMPGGERAKRDPKCLEELYQAIESASLAERDTLLAIGGGSLLDLAGYAVGTLNAPPRMVRVPTTAISQCEWGIAIKSTLHRFGRPDFQGVVSVPLAVINDTAFLKTLTDEAWLLGLAAAVRLALLRDGGFFEWMEDRADDLAKRDDAVLPALVQRSAELAAQRIALAGDPLERFQGPLFELHDWLTQRLNVPEGTAIAIGSAWTASYAYMTGHLAETEFQRVLDLFHRLGLPVYVEAMARLLDNPIVVEPEAPLRWTSLTAIGCMKEFGRPDELKLKAGMALLERFQRTAIRI